MNKEERSVKICKAMGHPVRFSIIKFLADGSRCVCDLTKTLGLVKATVSPVEGFKRSRACDK